VSGDGSEVEFTISIKMYRTLNLRHRFYAKLILNGTEYQSFPGSDLVYNNIDDTFILTLAPSAYLFPNVSEENFFEIINASASIFFHGGVDFDKLFISIPLPESEPMTILIQPTACK
jgi:hypothetical protein